MYLALQRFNVLGFWEGDTQGGPICSEKKGKRLGGKIVGGDDLEQDSEQGEK